MQILADYADFFLCGSLCFLCATLCKEIVTQSYTEVHRVAQRSSNFHLHTQTRRTLPVHHCRHNTQAQ
jgi:hypothetical protein